ncbi:galactokinase [Acidipila sp. EB88]|uniref:GHMP family kinase ATP-binding protein n=1 Tax=Acidipila sp. EB88 TaxID=2305226 RepID=UPI000F5EF3A8|nr:galactokinase [Acidipila sp. EB88]RRA49531.1 galactokinase [Acidipila sp. EB88]
MIIARTPLRISLGGGGTDLPSYYREFGGFVISAAINKYVYITANRSFFAGYFLKYSDTEHAETVDAIKHPLFREALKMHGIGDRVELGSVADVPAGTGLGSSGTFTVGLLHALYAYRQKHVASETLAQEAVEIEMNRLQQPVGKQDQYIAAYGGLLCQDYRRDGSVGVAPLNLPESTMRELEESLMLFFVGSTRSASALLQTQKTQSEGRDKKMLSDLHFAKQLGYETESVLCSGAVLSYGAIMHEHWLRKRQRSEGMSSSRVDELYELARGAGGATGGKLVGAGGSGFLLLQCADRKRLRGVMQEAGVDEMSFQFDFDGSVVMLRN